MRWYPLFIVLHHARDLMAPDARRREACLVERRSLAFETVFSAREKPEFLRRTRAAGYFVRLFFGGTADPTINASHVARRVMHGGQDVPISKIVALRPFRRELRRDRGRCDPW